jgi:hypothetical protein
VTEPDRRPTADFRAYAQQLQLDLRRLVEQGPELARQVRAMLNGDDEVVTGIVGEQLRGRR